MKRLEENALIFGRMMRVSEPHLVERYNEALVGFNLPSTKLKTFRIDMTGFSPEVADELGDRQYLDPHGVNRRFIILSPSQRELPVVHTAFSNTGQLMHEFFEANSRVINALTIKDVIFGEIDDPVLEARDIDDLLSIEQVEFKVSTGRDVAGQALKLRRMIDRVLKEPDGWRDDAMLEEMVAISKSTGDIRANELVPQSVIFRHDAFWTSHFGGLYVFIDEKDTTVIGDPDAPGFRRSRPWQVSYIDRRDADLVFRFLTETGRVDLPRGSWIERSGYLKHRIHMLITMLAFLDDPDDDHEPHSGKWRRHWTRRNSKLIEKEGTLPFLQWAQREYESWATLDLNEVDARGRFILSRAKPGHEDQWLVNRLISDYVPFDFVSRYIFNKPSFYGDYEGWGEELREYAVETIQHLYHGDKRGFRRRLYGHHGSD
ncbi:MAG: DUF6638 family protein [Pseudomonadota bacterium]